MEHNEEIVERSWTLNAFARLTRQQYPTFVSSYDMPTHLPTASLLPQYYLHRTHVRETDHTSASAAVMKERDMQNNRFRKDQDEEGRSWAFSHKHGTIGSHASVIAFYTLVDFEPEGQRYQRYQTDTTVG